MCIFINPQCLLRKIGLLEAPYLPSRYINQAVASPVKITTGFEIRSTLTQTILFVADNPEADEVASSGVMFIVSSSQYTDIFNAY